MVIHITSDLEELVFEGERILRKSNKKEVKAIRPVGYPVLIGTTPSDFPEDNIDNSQLIYIDLSAPRDANAYSVGNEDVVAGEIVGSGNDWMGIPVQYYKIR